MKWKIVLIATTLLVQVDSLCADGGAVRFSERRGTHRITVFTSPTPLQAGLMDVSVLVQNADSKTALTMPPITVSAHPVKHPSRIVSATASSESATIKLMQAATLDLSEPGTWHVEVRVLGDNISFNVEVGEAPPAWLDMALWIGWPFVLIAAFAIHQRAAYAVSASP